MWEGVKYKALNVANVAWLGIATQDVVSFSLEVVGVCTLIWFNVERAAEARMKRKKNEDN